MSLYKIKIFIVFLFIFWVFCYSMLYVIFFFAPAQKYYKNKKLVSNFFSMGLYPRHENLILNYSGKCGEIFKYKKNSNRDLIIFSYHYIIRYKYRNIKNLVINSLDSVIKSMPNAKIICFVSENSLKSKIVKILRRLNVEVIVFDEFKDIHIVTSRFFLSLKYLKQNKDKFDRVILSDLNDVFMLNDIFSTFNESQILINKECSNYDNTICNYFNSTNIVKWLNASYYDNKDLFNYIYNLKKPILNAGVIMGGIEKIISFLTILTSNFDLKKAKRFGYDEIILNQLFYYDNKFKDLDFIIEGCGQKICFRSKSIVYDFDSKIVQFKENQCSPVIIHKNFPNFWNYGSLGTNIFSKVYNNNNSKLFFISNVNNTSYKDNLKIISDL
jgi:hypothetical protein